MPKGELSLSGTSGTPALVDAWPLERKHYEIRKWLLDNFVLDSDFDFDFSDWDNDDELENSYEIETLRAREILLDNFGTSLKATEFEAIVQLLDKEFDDEWRPAEIRIEVEEIEDDDEDFEDFSDLRKKIPLLIERVSQVRDALFPHIGHNQPPEGLQFSAIELEDLSSLLLSAQMLPEEPSVSDFALLEKLGRAAIKIGAELISYVAKKGDLFLEKAIASAGDATGKWAVRVLVLATSGQLLRQFGESMIKLTFGN